MRQRGNSKVRGSEIDETACGNPRTVFALVAGAAEHAL